MKMKVKHDFYVTPTLIDSYLWYDKFGRPEDKFQELINKINKVPIEYPEIAKRGVAFEDVVNLNISGQKIYNKDGFEFKPELVEKIANKLKNNVGTQVWIEKTVNFHYGKIRIGGFVDYMYDTRIVDLKTTSRYKLGKYKDNSQHKAYGLIKEEKKDFVYYITDMENAYIEPYENKKSNHAEFLNNCELFYEFTQEHRELITDTKIFGK